jgi:hypothetical protein
MIEIEKTFYTVDSKLHRRLFVAEFYSTIRKIVELRQQKKVYAQW